MIILGFDPGTARTGFGVIKKLKKNKKGFSNIQKKISVMKMVDCGCILTEPNLDQSERLKKIYKEVNKLIKKYRPKLIAIESVYFFKNLKTVIPVSQTRGIILLAAAQNKTPTCEITPLQMKMSIVGYGRAEKKQIQKMIEVILELKKPIKSDDAADALGIAICGGIKKEIE